MKNLLLHTGWPIGVTKSAWGSAAGAAAHRPPRNRRSAWPELLSLQPQRPVATDAGDDDFDSSWFASSRALAQGLQVTEHSASLEVLLRRGG